MNLYMELPSVKPKQFQAPDFKKWLDSLYLQAKTHNDKVVEAISDSYRVMMNEAVVVYGERSRQVKYLRREGFENKPDIDHQYQLIMKRYNKYLSNVKTPKQLFYDPENPLVVEGKAEEYYLPGEYHNPDKPIRVIRNA